MTAFGDLHIIAMAQIGGAAPVKSEPILYHWPWYWHLPRLGLWALLGLAVAVPRSNRDRRSLLIFIPLLVLGLLWQRTAGLMGIPSYNQVEFGSLIEALAVGAALLWLNADKLGRCRGLRRAALGLGLVLLASLVTVLIYRSTYPDEIPMFLSLVTIMGIALLLSLALARRWTGRRYHPARFALWLAVWSVLGSLVGVIAFVGGMTLLTSSGPDDLSDIGTQVLLPGVIFGVCLYAIHLPYMLLMFTSPFFRQRFRVWLGVEPLLPHAQAANPEDFCSGRNE